MGGEGEISWGERVKENSPQIRGPKERGCSLNKFHISKFIHYITLHYITLHYITLHYITLHYLLLVEHVDRQDVTVVEALSSRGDRKSHWRKDDIGSKEKQIYYSGVQ